MQETQNIEQDDEQVSAQPEPAVEPQEDYKPAFAVGTVSVVIS